MVGYDITSYGGSNHLMFQVSSQNTGEAHTCKYYLVSDSCLSTITSNCGDIALLLLLVMSKKVNLGEVSFF